MTVKQRHTRGDENTHRGNACVERITKSDGGQVAGARKKEKEKSRLLSYRNNCFCTNIAVIIIFIVSYYSMVELKNLEVSL